ncbi:unnamed protein product [Rhizophagus irregularis]|nr:unnamed protein product [Rhizophagus irregularis]CAB4441077.1 unnamed protein product [Rhizophagus irregularis]
MLKIQEKHTECNILRENNFNFIQILNQQSEILLGKSKDWELIRGDFNNRFNKISSKIEVKNLIDDLWYFCYDQCRINIWNKRCDEVNEIEKKKGIKKMNKRKRKIKELEVDIEENKEKSKKRRK